MDYPNGTTWKLFYNPYAEIAKVMLPTGGAVEYDFSAGLSNAGSTAGTYASGQVLDNLNLISTFGSSQVPWRPFIYRRLQQRREYNSAIAGEGNLKRTEAPWKTSDYGRFESAGQPYHYPQAPAGTVQDFVLASTGLVPVIHSGANGAASITEGHKFHDLIASNGNGGALQATSPGTTIKYGAQSNADVLVAYADLFQGKEYHTEVGGGGTPLRMVDQAFGLEQQVGSAKPCHENTTIQDGGGAITSTRIKLYDRNASGVQVTIANPLGLAGTLPYSFGNVSDLYEYGFDSSVPMNDAGGGRLCPAQLAGGWSKHTHTDYHAGSQYFSSSLFLPSLTTSEQVFDVGGQIAGGSYAYDAAGTIAPGDFYGSVPNAAMCASGSSATRGNVSSIAKSIYNGNTLKNSVIESFFYDCVGNLRKHTDARSVSTTFSFADSFFGGSPGFTTYAYLTQIDLPNGASVTRQYDFSTGKPRKETDPNGLVTMFSFADTLNRLHSIERGVGAAANIDAMSTFTYTDGPSAGSMPSSVQAVRGQYTSGDARLNSQSFYDAFGRNVRAAVNGTETIQANTVYDGNGLVRQRCNPLKPGVSSSTDGCATFTYDALGRLLSAQTADGSQSTTSFSVQGTAPRMAVETVTDAANVQRKLQYDAFGRLMSVTEVGPNYVTSYQYDMLDNLTQVTVPGQSRTFTYDSQKRLLTANNPESGAISYAYDANGNLTQRTDARGTVTCYGTWNGANCDGAGYDGLNRVVKISYSDTTPVAVFCYDGFSYSGGSCVSQAAGQKMRRTGAGNSVSATSNTYDVAGRLTASTQSTSGSVYGFAYSYYLSDALAGTAMPSQRTYTNCYDANQRAIWVSAVRTSVDCTSGVASGSTIAQVQNFAPTGGPNSILLGNGLIETTSYNNRTQVTGRTAALGGVNRLALNFYYCGAQQLSCVSNNGNLQSQTVGNAAGGSEAAFLVSQTYGYDGANRLSSITEDSASQTYGYDQPGNRWVSGNAGFPVNPLTPTFPSAYSGSNNRLTMIGYDTSGNQTQLNPFTLAYDAENRMTSATSAGNGTGSYGYDADGRRVVKTANGIGSVFVYDGFGQLAAEYGGTAGGPSGTQYVTGDHLESTRLVTDAGGNVGEEV